MEDPRCHSGTPGRANANSLNFSGLLGSGSFLPLRAGGPRDNNFRIAENFSARPEDQGRMFINDTGRLPDSGRVCVVGFQSTQAAPRIYYSVAINAARAEVEPMEEPRNPAHVLGVGGEIRASKGPVFAAYFAASRDRFDAQPNY